MDVHWEDWSWNWNSNTLATWFEELTHLKRPWCWERLKAGEGDDRGWDGWMALPTQWTWVWVNSGSWWWIGRPDVLWFMGLQRVGHDWATELNWTEHSNHDPAQPKIKKTNKQKNEVNSTLGFLAFWTWATFLFRWFCGWFDDFRESWAILKHFSALEVD